MKAQIEKKYPPGTRLELIHMDDPYPILEGTQGSVSFIDDMGHIHMNWDNGSTLSLIEGTDKFKVVDSPEETPMDVNQDGGLDDRR